MGHTYHHQETKNPSIAIQLLLLIHLRIPQYWEPFLYTISLPECPMAKHQFTAITSYQKIQVIYQVSNEITNEWEKISHTTGKLRTQTILTKFWCEPCYSQDSEFVRQLFDGVRSHKVVKSISIKSIRDVASIKNKYLYYVLVHAQRDTNKSEK